MRIHWYAILLLLPCSFAIPELRAQTNFEVTIRVSDGSAWTDSVIIGKNTAATNAIGDSLSPLLHESERPPLPPSGANQAADARLVSPPGGGAYGQGVGVDLRHLVSDGQKDVYRLQFRRGDPAGSFIVISWDPGLGSVGSGGFLLTDGVGGAVFSPVSMVDQTSFSHSSFNSLSGGIVDIVIGDASEMRTFGLDSIALAVDMKGKIGKYEKRKPWATDFRFTAIVPSPGVDRMDLDLKQYVDGTVSFPGDTSGRVLIPLSFVKKQTLLFDPPLLSGQMVAVEGRAYKQSKPFVQKYRWYLGQTQSDVFLADYQTRPGDYQNQRLPMPNVNNLGEELYAAGVRLPIGLPVQVDSSATGKPIFREILHGTKWTEVEKSLVKKVGGIYELQSGPANCLDTLKSKTVYKALKSLDPKSAIRLKTTADYGNSLVGQLIALKFNIAISAHGHTSAMGFGELIFTKDAHPYNGKTVDEIAALGDSAISCVGGLLGGYTCADFAAFLDTLNREFSGPFDTVEFATKTIVTGVKTVAESDIFVGSGATFGPPPAQDFSALYDVPETYGLAQNYPNPFNPTTTIEFNLAEDAVITLRVYNMLGQLVTTLADREEFSSGANWVEFDAGGLSSGVYLYHLVAEGTEGGSPPFSKVMKMLVMK